MLYRDVHRIRKQQTTGSKYYDEQIDQQAIKTSIRNILMVPKGSLPGDSEFGSRIHEIIFSQLDGLTSKLQDTFIREALTKYEKRQRIKNISFERVPEFNRLNINIAFEYLDYRTGEVLKDKTTLPINLF